MEKRELKVGNIVQINPTVHKGFFPGCFMVVTEPKAFGAQGYIATPRSRDEPPAMAYYRAKWDEMELVGHAEWIAGSHGEEAGDEVPSPNQS